MADDLSEFEVAGHLYRLDGLPAQTETRILRRFAPIIAELMPLVLCGGTKFKLRSNIEPQKMFQRVMASWGKLTDDDIDFIERASVGALSRQVGSTWHPVWPKGEAEPVFPDIDGSVLEQLTGWANGLTVMRWVRSSSGSLPPQIRVAVQHLH